MDCTSPGCGVVVLRGGFPPAPIPPHDLTFRAVAKRGGQWCRRCSSLARRAPRPMHRLDHRPFSPTAFKFRNLLVRPPPARKSTTHLSRARRWTVPAQCPGIECSVRSRSHPARVQLLIATPDPRRRHQASSHRGRGRSRRPVRAHASRSLLPNRSPPVTDRWALRLRSVRVVSAGSVVTGVPKSGLQRQSIRRTISAKRPRHDPPPPCP